MPYILPALLLIVGGTLIGRGSMGLVLPVSLNP